MKSRWNSILLLFIALMVVSYIPKKKSFKKRILIGISSIVVIMSFLTVSPVLPCEETHLENVTSNVTVPYSRCDISGPVINCYNSEYIKEVTTLVNVTTSSSCSLVNR